MSPTQRTLALLRKTGAVVGVTEKWNQFAHIRQDLFGIGDILAFHPGERWTLLVQATSASNVSARVQKMAAHENTAKWLRCGHQFAVIGWGLRGERGKKKFFKPIYRTPVLFHDEIVLSWSDSPPPCLVPAS